MTLIIALLALRAVAEDAPKPPEPEWKFALHGFLGGSLYAQDGFSAPSPGQQTLWGVGETGTHRVALGGDIRQNRLNFSLAGPSVLGGTPKGVAEIDFFGGNSSGGFGDVSVFPRARVMYAELAWPNTTLRVGQEYQLTAGINTLSGPATSGAMNFPTSVGHVAFPVSFAAGAIGWRYPGIFVYHRLPMGDNKMEIALSVQRGAWVNPANPGTGTGAAVAPPGTVTITNPYFTTGTDLGDASGIPQLEARVTYAMGSLLGVALYGHYASVDPYQWGAAPVPTTSGGKPCGTALTTPAGVAANCSALTVYAVGAVFRLNLEPIILQGGGYTGQNTSAMLGEMLQFNNLGAGNTSDWGAWAQLGFKITKELGIYAFAGTDHPDATAATLGGLKNLKNTAIQGMLRYYDKGWAYGLEWTHWHTNTNGFPGAVNGVDPVKDTAIDVNQYMFSTYYFF